MSKPQVKLRAVEQPSFFATLYAGKPDDLYALVWTKDPKNEKKVSRYFKDLNKATSYAEKQGATLETYFGLGLSAKAKESYQRVESSEVAGIPGVWVEVDYGTEGHASDDKKQKKSYPPTQEAALELIGLLPVKPTFIIHSGNGFHCYWQFKEFWTFANDKEREAAQTLVRRWQQLVKDRARNHGWHVDATQDLARVYRVPGTLNHKSDQTKQVTIHTDNRNVRYTRAELEAHLSPEPTQKKQKQHPTSSVDASNLILKADAQPPKDKFDKLYKKTLFRQSCQRKRKDLEDGSASGYDFSLASFAAHAGWTDQEIADLRISQRREHGDDLKLRQDYYKGTIAAARTKREATNERAAGVSSDNEPQIESLSETGNAMRFARLFGEDLRYSKKLNDWLVWYGKHWKAQDELLQVEAKAKEVVKAIDDEVKLTEDSNLRIAIRKHAIATEKAKAQREMVALAKSHLAIELSRFDAKPYLLNCANGTYDFSTASWYEHSRLDYLTRLAPVDFDASAKCPKILEYLARMFKHDEEMLLFLKRAIGASLLAERSKSKLIIIYGEQDTGKTTLIELMRSLLGRVERDGYAGTLMPQTLMLNKYGDSNNTDLTSVRGSRFVSVSETERGQRLNEALIKHWTGGGIVKGKKLYQNPTEFPIEFKIWLDTNYRPEIDPEDKALWSRLALIPCEVVIPTSEQRAIEKVLAEWRDEMPGLLAWAVEGCHEYMKSGLRVPDKVRRATESYRAEMDLIGDFIKEKCVLGKQHEVLSTSLWQLFSGWLMINGEDETKFSQRKLTQQITARHGISTDRENGTGRTLLRGIGLRSALENSTDTDDTRAMAYGKKQKYMREKESNKNAAGSF